MNKKEVIGSLIFKFAERFSVKGLGFIIGIVLARLLSPDDFGLIAIMMVFINLSLAIIEGGLNTALVQSKEADDKDYSTVFYISASLAAIMVVVIFFSAPFIASYYKSSSLILPLRVYALSLFFGAFNSIQLAKVQREMLFKQQLKCSVIATGLSGVLGVVLAYMGSGLWALVAYYFAQTVLYCISLSTVVRWLPRSRFSAASAKRLYGFGIRMLATSLLTSLYNDLRVLIIWKKFTTEDLGFYSRGQQFTTVISVNMESALQTVMFPVYSRSQDDPERLRAMMRRALSVSTTLMFPLMLGMSAVAEPMVRLLLTEKWLPCVIFIKILCIGDAALPLTSTNLVALKATGDSKAYVRIEVIRRVAMLIVLLVSVFAFDSVEAIACGYAISGWIEWMIASQPIKKRLSYGIGEQIKDIWKAGAAALIMLLAVNLLGTLQMPVWAMLIVQVISGIAVYSAVCIILKAEGFLYALKLAKSIIASRS